mmetsp:Transcript_17768/g.57545  ORF Transcript_17768/g.57545 Transcript_17768/m.57545 type:complete len:332 (-) Transcript_17768:238-1233(-)
MSSSGVVDDAELRRRLSRSTIVPRRSNQWQRSDSPPQIRRPEDASFVARGASFHRQRGDEGTLQRIRETTKTRSASSRPTESRVEREVHRRDVPTSRRPRRLVRSAAQRRRSTLRDLSFLPVSTAGTHEADPRRRLSRPKEIRRSEDTPFRHSRRGVRRVNDGRPIDGSANSFDDAKSSPRFPPRPPHEDSVVPAPFVGWDASFEARIVREVRSTATTSLGSILFTHTADAATSTTRVAEESAVPSVRCLVQAPLSSVGVRPLGRRWASSISTLETAGAMPARPRQQTAQDRRVRGPSSKTRCSVVRDAMSGRQIDDEGGPRTSALPSPRT